MILGDSARSFSTERVHFRNGRRVTNCIVRLIVVMDCEGMQFTMVAVHPLDIGFYPEQLSLDLVQTQLPPGEKKTCSRRRGNR